MALEAGLFGWPEQVPKQGTLSSSHNAFTRGCYCSRAVSHGGEFSLFCLKVNDIACHFGGDYFVTAGSHSIKFWYTGDQARIQVMKRASSCLHACLHLECDRLVLTQTRMNYCFMIIFGWHSHRNRWKGVRLSLVNIVQASLRG